MMNRTLLAELEERGQSITSDLAARAVDPILLNDTFALHRPLAETLVNHSDIIYAFVLESQGQVLVHTFEGGFPRELLRLHSTVDDTNIMHLLYNSDQGRIHDFAAPNPSRCAPFGLEMWSNTAGLRRCSSGSRSGIG